MTTHTHEQVFTIPAADFAEAATGAVLPLFAADSELFDRVLHDGSDLQFVDSNGDALPQKIGWQPYVRRGPVDWTWFRNKQALYSNGKTWVSYYGMENGTWDVSVYTHATGEWDHYELADTGAAIDGHEDPALAVTSDGTIYALCATTVGTILRLYKTTTPGDPTTFALTNLDSLVTNRVSYARLYVMTGDKLALVYRSGTGTTNRYNVVRFSTDGGATFGAASELFYIAGERSYMQVASDGAEKLHIVASNGHPREAASTNIYHLYYDDSTGKLYESDGTEIGDLGSVSPNASNTTLIESLTPDLWPSDLAIDESGNPAVVYSSHTDHYTSEYRYGKWTGSAWETNSIVSAGESIATLQSVESEYIAGLAIDYANVNRIAYSVPGADGTLRMYVAITDDDGATWTATAITSGNGPEVWRPHFVENGVNALQLVYIAGEHVNYDDSNGDLVAWPSCNTGADLTSLVEVDLDGSTDLEVTLRAGGGTALSRTAPTGTLMILGDVTSKLIGDSEWMDAASLTIAMRVRIDTLAADLSLLSDWADPPSASNSHILFNAQNSPANEMFTAFMNASGGQEAVNTSGFGSGAVAGGWRGRGWKLDSTAASFFQDGTKNGVTDTVTGGLSSAGAEQLFAGYSEHDVDQTLDGAITAIVGYDSAKTDAWVQAVTKALADPSLITAGTLVAIESTAAGAIAGILTDLAAGQVGGLTPEEQRDQSNPGETYFQVNGQLYARLGGHPAVSVDELAKGGTLVEVGPSETPGLTDAEYFEQNNPTAGHFLDINNKLYAVLAGEEYRPVPRDGFE